MAGLINGYQKYNCIPKLMLDFNISSWGIPQNSLTPTLLKKWKAFAALDILRYNKL